MEISSKMVDSLFNVFFLQGWILGIFSFGSERLDSVAKVEMSSGRIDSVVDDLDVSLCSVI
jgi:hypothetical protein